MKVPENGKALSTQTVITVDENIAEISSEGRMLVFPVSDLPELARGKGNKISNIPKNSYQTGVEKLQAIAVLGEGRELKLISGKRHFTIKTKDLENFKGSRGLRGNFLPKGFRKVDSTEVVSKSSKENKTEEAPKIFENSNPEKKDEIKEPEMFEETNLEEDFEIPAFLRRQKN